MIAGIINNTGDLIYSFYASDKYDALNWFKIYKKIMVNPKFWDDYKLEMIDLSTKGEKGKENENISQNESI